MQTICILYGLWCVVEYADSDPKLSKLVFRLMLILRFGLAHVLFSNYAHMCLRIVPLTDNSKLIFKIPMIMKNQLLNLKMIALMCLMMVLGGANVWAADVLKGSWDLTKKSQDWVATGNLTYFGQPYGYNSKGGTLTNKSIKDFSAENVSKIKVGFKCLQNGAENGELTIYLVDSNGSPIGSGQVVKPVNKSTPTSTTYQYATFTSDLEKATGFMMKVTKYAYKKILINGASYEITRNLKSYDVTWNVNGADYTEGTPTIKVAEGGKVSVLPTAPEAKYGKSFVGWTDVTLSATQDVKPAILFTDATDAPKVTGNVTYYAVFADSKYTGATAVKIAQTLEYDTWTYSGETVDKTSYRLFTKDSYVESAEFDLSTLAKVVVYGGTYGGDQYNSLTIGDGVKVWKKGVVTGKEATGVNPFEDGTPLSGNGKLRIISNVGSLLGTIPNGVRVSKIEIYTNQPVPTYYGYCTTVGAADEPTYTPVKVNFVAHAGADYYATFSNANVVFMPKDVTISTVAVENNSIVLCNSTEGYLGKEETVKIAGNNVAGYYIPANTGVLLNSKNSGEVTYYTVENKKVAAYSAILNNMLMPSVAGGEFTADPGKVYYKLAYNDYTANTGLGFYWGADNGGAFSVKAGTAYLAVPAGETTAKGFAFNGEATGIEGVNANVENAKAIYNLNGQRVASMAKPGLYIVNGKKVVRK